MQGNCAILWVKARSQHFAPVCKKVLGRPEKGCCWWICCWLFQVLVFSTCVQRICKAAGQWKATAAKGVNSAMFKFVTKKKTANLPIKPWKVTSTAGEKISSNTPAMLAACCITEKEICQPEKSRAQSFKCWGRPVCFHWWILANCPAMSFVLVLDIPM